MPNSFLLYSRQSTRKSFGTAYTNKDDDAAAVAGNGAAGGPMNAAGLSAMYTTVIKLSAENVGNPAKRGAERKRAGVAQYFRDLSNQPSLSQHHLPNTCRKSTSKTAGPCRLSTTWRHSLWAVKEKAGQRQLAPAKGRRLGARLRLQPRERLTTAPASPPSPRLGTPLWTPRCSTSSAPRAPLTPA